MFTTPITAKNCHSICCTCDFGKGKQSWYWIHRGDHCLPVLLFAHENNIRVICNQSHRKSEMPNEARITSNMILHLNGDWKTLLYSLIELTRKGISFLAKSILSWVTPINESPMRKRFGKQTTFFVCSSQGILLFHMIQLTTPVCLHMSKLVYIVQIVVIQIKVKMRMGTQL